MQEQEVSYYFHDWKLLLRYTLFLGEDTKDKGKLYKPQSRVSTTHENMSSAEKAQAYAKLLSTEKKPERLGKKKPPTKSNLEAFKEELRQYVIQKEWFQL